MVIRVPEGVLGVWLQVTVGQCWGTTSRRKVGLSQEIRVPVPHLPTSPPSHTHSHTHTHTHTHSLSLSLSHVCRARSFPLVLPAMAQGSCCPPSLLQEVLPSDPGPSQEERG